MVVPNEWDFQLRHASVLAGAYVGFRFAWRGLGGYDAHGLPVVPHSHSWAWVMNPASPNDREAGAWGDQIWRFYALISVGLPNISGRQPQPYAGPVVSNDPLLQLGWLRAFRNLPAITMKQPTDDTVDNVVRVYGYEERLLESYDAAHYQEGSYLVILDLVETIAVG